MSEIKVNKISPRTDCGTTTLGDSGDTFNVPSGSKINVASGGNITVASGATITNNGTQTGFGRTGTVDWQTGSIKTATFTATSGEGYFCNTAGGSFEVDLPTGSAGDIVSVQDYNNTFDSHGLIVDPPAGQKINGGTNGGKITLDTEGEGVTLVYIDSTVGWRSIHQSSFADVGADAEFVAASGGNATLTNGNFKTHIFTGPGTFTVTCGGNACGSNTVDYVVVAGGGGGGKGAGPDGAGGGGAGGMRLSNSTGCVPAPTMSPLVAPAALPVSAQAYSIVVGGGGAGHTPCGPGGPTGVGVQGGTSSFSTISSAGGGYGSYGAAAGAGGSGGGAHQNTNGSGNTPPVSPPQGNPGSGGGPPYPPPGGGGGGAGFSAIQSDGSGGPPRGGTFNPSQGGDGGDGSFVADTVFGPTAPSYGTPGLTASTRYFAGGGGGGPSPSRGGQSNSNGGQGGGAPGVASTKTPGTINTGGGGAGNEAFGGGNGGSGIVIIRYKFQ